MIRLAPSLVLTRTSSRAPICRLIAHRANPDYGQIHPLMKSVLRTVVATTQIPDSRYVSSVSSMEKPSQKATKIAAHPSKAEDLEASAKDSQIKDDDSQLGHLVFARTSAGIGAPR